MHIVGLELTSINALVVDGQLLLWMSGLRWIRHYTPAGGFPTSALGGVRITYEDRGYRSAHYQCASQQTAGRAGDRFLSFRLPLRLCPDTWQLSSAES